MWRSFFLAVGLTLCILGGECLIVDKAFVTLAGRGGREFVPPEWAPWSLLSAGAVVSLYSLTVARQS
jgi:hypothetical protein